MARRKGKSNSGTGKSGSPRRPIPASDEQEIEFVTLWGEVTAETDTHLQFAIANVEDALRIGISGKQWVKKLQLFGRGRLDGYDWIRIRVVLASLLAQMQREQCRGR
jgi:hypothetical protein